MMPEADFLHYFPVSAGQLNKLQQYAQMLLYWNQRINLIGKSTENALWQRHFLDCAALASYLPEKPSPILDVGSGAGLPGLILSIITAHPVSMVESSSKKVTFLREVKKKLSLSCTIYHGRAEEISKKEKFSVITARAVTDLDTLWQWTLNSHSSHTIGIFLKGKDHDEELIKFRQNNPNYLVKRYPHPHSDGYIIYIS